MKKIVIPAVLASVMASGFTFAAELPASIKDKGEIVVAIMPNYPPMDFKDPATNTSPASTTTWAMRWPSVWGEDQMAGNRF